MYVYIREKHTHTQTHAHTYRHRQCVNKQAAPHVFRFHSWPAVVAGPQCARPSTPRLPPPPLPLPYSPPLHGTPQSTIVVRVPGLFWEKRAICASSDSKINTNIASPALPHCHAPKIIPLPQSVNREVRSALQGKSEVQVLTMILIRSHHFRHKSWSNSATAVG